jgi:hypothetical protein
MHLQDIERKSNDNRKEAYFFGSAYAYLTHERL